MAGLFSNCFRRLETSAPRQRSPRTLSVVLITSLAPLACATSVAAPPAAASPATDFFRAFREEIEARYYPHAGVDLDKILDREASALAAACTATGAECPTDVGVQAARRAVADFKDPHTHIDKVEGGGPMQPGATGRRPASAPSMGWTVRRVEPTGELYVSWLANDGAAAKAGIARFDHIVDANRTAAQLTRLSEDFIVTVDHRGETRSLTLSPELREQTAPQPRMERVGDVAVIQYPSGSAAGGGQAFHDLVGQAMRDAARGIVVDLRDNGGGGIECGAAGGAFLDYGVVMTERSGDARTLTVTQAGARMVGADDVEALTLERPVRWSGPLAIIVNRRTASCAEAFAIEASLAHRAVIVGEDSVGVGNNVVAPVALPEGWRMMMAIAYATDLSGSPLPARPAIDVAVADDPIAIGRTGKDPALKAAIAALNPSPATARGSR